MVKVLPLLCAAALSACGDHRSAQVQVTDLWAQPVDAAGTTVAVYMTIADRCSRPEKLQSVSAQSPRKASLHRSSVVDDALSMTPMDSVAVGCTSPTQLKPMGMHVMVTSLQKPVGIGDRIPLMLTFDRSGNVNVVAEVTTMAVLENVDPMHMHRKAGGMGGMHMH